MLPTTEGMLAVTEGRLAMTGNMARPISHFSSPAHRARIRGARRSSSSRCWLGRG
jgi:hypothetical protein